MNKLVTTVFCALCIVLSSCKKDENTTSAINSTETLFERIPSEKTGIDFVNKVENQKNFNIFKYRNFYNGGGVAIGDINNDGLQDIYLTGNMEPNKLYLNKGDFVFEDISATAGVEGNKPWSTGVLMVDVNADAISDDMTRAELFRLAKDFVGGLPAK